MVSTLTTATAQAQGSVTPAEILNLDHPGSPAITCMFNPKEYSFAKQNQWTRKQNSGKNVPPLEFGSGQPAKLTMQLTFDTYATGKDVRKEHTNAIWELMLVDPSTKHKKSDKARPPKVRFQWGKMWSFDAVVESITQKFTLFLADGTPVRAVLDVTFQQVEDKLFQRQNPTSGGEGGERVWTVKADETLAWIAYKELGDPNDWRRIAEVNRLTEVRDLTPGMVLRIPNA